MGTTTDEMIDIGRPEGNEPAGKLIVTIGGEERDYPIVSDVPHDDWPRPHQRHSDRQPLRQPGSMPRSGPMRGATIIEDAGSKNGVLVQFSSGSAAGFCTTATS